MVNIRKEQIPVLAANLIILLVFGVLFSYRQNWEFIAYIGLIVFLLLVIILTNNKVSYPNIVLWGLTLWALMHLAGGGIRFGDERLYNLMILTLSETYSVLRYDQIVHMIVCFIFWVVI